MKKVKEGYKKTELGEIPNEWNIINLKEVIKEFIVPMRDKPKVFDGNIPWCRIEDIEGNYLNGNKENRFVSEKVIEKMNLKVFPKGTLIASCSATLGVYAINTIPLITNQTFIGLVPTEKINVYYLLYYMKGATDRLKNIASGTTIPYISRQKFEEFKIVLPNIEEQEKIASILSTVDDQINNIDGLIEKNKELKKGLMQQLLTKGIGHTKFKKTEIGEIPETWEVDSIGNLSTFCSNGFVGTATPYYSENGTNYLMSNNVRANKIDTRSIVKVNKEFVELYPRTRIFTGDMLTVQSGHIGTSCVVPKEYNNCNCHALIITRFNKDIIDSNFVSYYLNSNIGIGRLSTIFVGSTIKHINVKDLVKFNIPIPSIEEQEIISSILSEVDEKIDKYKKKKEKLEELKKGLMQELLTGRTRVI